MNDNEDTRQALSRNIALLVTLVTTPLTLVFTSVAPKDFSKQHTEATELAGITISVYLSLTMIMLAVGILLTRDKPVVGGFLVLSTVPRSWITLSWVFAGAVITLITTSTILGLIITENICLTIFYVIYAVICCIGLLCLLFQWFTKGLKLTPLKNPSPLVLFAVFFISSLPLYQVGRSFLFIGFSQSLFLLACLTGKTGSVSDNPDPMVARMVFACAAGFLVMSTLLSFFHTELSTKPAALLFLPSLPLIICVLTYSGIRAVQPFKK